MAAKNSYDRPDTFFYLDPPYDFGSERSARKLYEHEMTAEDHARLVDILIRLKGKAMLSGYDTPVYESLIAAGWRKYVMGEQAVTVNKKANGEKRLTRIECVWENYEIPKM